MSKIGYFKTDLYQGLDFSKYVASKYGESANLVSTGDHLFDWEVHLQDGSKSRLKIEDVISFQYGAGYIAIRTGVTKNDWKAARISDLENYYILPAIVLAGDVYRDIREVQTALTNVVSSMTYVQSWYLSQVGNKTFSMLAPIVLLSEKDSAAWEEVSESTRVDEPDPNRYNLLTNLKQEFQNAYTGLAGANNIGIVLLPYIKNGENVCLGACCDNSKYTIGTPHCSSQSMPEYGLLPRLNDVQSDIGYALAHELGHFFGLPHPDKRNPKPPNADASVMQAAKMPNAILLGVERDVLKKSPYFSDLES